MLPQWFPPLLLSQHPLAIKLPNKPPQFEETPMKKSLLFVFILTLASFNSFACGAIAKAKEYVSEELGISENLLHAEADHVESDSDSDWISKYYNVEVKSSPNGRLLAKLYVEVFYYLYEECEDSINEVFFIVDNYDENDLVVQKLLDGPNAIESILHLSKSWPTLNTSSCALHILSNPNSDLVEVLITDHGQLPKARFYLAGQKDYKFYFKTDISGEKPLITRTFSIDELSLIFIESADTYEVTIEIAGGQKTSCSMER